MRTNLPVTQNQYSVREDCAIISHTDEKGLITYVNDDFVEYAGFNREELIGKPHNIIRHPDMPEEAFRDMWATLNSGRAWQGMVKNRRKNGDHYWVKATASPRPDGGYMSVRLKASEQEINDAESLYRSIREGSGHKLKHGYVIAPGIKGRLSAPIRTYQNMGFIWKLLIPLLFGATLLLAVLAQQLNNLYEETLDKAGEQNASDLITMAFNLRTFYSKQVVSKAQSAGLEISHDPDNNPHSIPLPATVMRSLGEMSKGKGGSEFRLFSDKPFTFRTASETRLDDFEKKALNYLKDNPDGIYSDRIIQNGKEYYRLARADVMNHPSCIACHNNHPNSQKTDWKLGDVRGVAEAKVPLDSLQAAYFSPIINMGIALSIVIIGLVLTVALVTSSLRQRIQRLRQIAFDTASGNLVAPIPMGRNDELGKLLNGFVVMRNRLYEMIFQIGSSTQVMNHSVQEMISASEETTKGAVEQSNSSTSMAAALEELSASVEQIGLNADEAHETSTAAGEIAKTGSEAVYTSSEEMQVIAESVKNCSHQIIELKTLSENIGQIVSTISDIAEQTNLLALNAAIEAARAGEQGRGFAVVADEVRGLAERTSRSTIEITEMVNQIQQQTETTAEQMQASVIRVEEGVEKAQEAGKSVAEIETGTAQVVTVTDNIRQLLSEQALAAREVAQTVERIAHLADTNAAQAEQAHGVSKEVQSAAKVLDNLRNEFKVFK